MAKIPPADIVDSIGRMSPEERRALREMLDEPPAPAVPVVPSEKKKRTAMSPAERDADDLLNEFGPSQMTIESVGGKTTYRMRTGDVEVEAVDPDKATKLLLEALRAKRNKKD